jgi:hypothetical protein
MSALPRNFPHHAIIEQNAANLFIRVRRAVRKDNLARRGACASQNQVQRLGSRRAPNLELALRRAIAMLCA